MDKDLTIFITTKNRDDILLKTLKYYDEIYNGTILVVDSSGEKNRLILDSTEYTFDLEYIIDYDDLPQQKLFERYGKIVTTDYVLWSGDDDVYIMNTIRELKNAIKYKKNIGLGAGKSIATYQNSVGGLIHRSEIYSLPDIEEYEQYERFINLTNSFSPGLFYLMKRDIWLHMISGIGSVEDKAYATEYFPSFVALMLSSVCFSEELGLIRTIHPKRFTLIRPKEFGYCDLTSVQNSKNLLVKRILSLSTDTRLNPNLVYKKISGCFDDVDSKVSRLAETAIRYGRRAVEPNIVKLRVKYTDFAKFYNLMNQSAKKNRILIIWGNVWLLETHLEFFESIKKDDTEIVLVTTDQNIKVNEIFISKYVGEGKLFRDLIELQRDFDADVLCRIDTVVSSLRVFAPTRIYTLSIVYDIEKVLVYNISAPVTVIWPHVCNLYHYKTICIAITKGFINYPILYMLSLTKFLRYRCGYILRSMNLTYIIAYYTALFFDTKVGLAVELFALKCTRFLVRKLVSLSLPQSQVEALLKPRAFVVFVSELFRRKFRINLPVQTFNSIVWSKSFIAKILILWLIKRKYSNSSMFVLERLGLSFKSTGPIGYSTKIGDRNEFENLTVYSIDQENLYKKIFNSAIVNCKKFPNASKGIGNAILFAPSLKLFDLDSNTLEKIGDDVISVMNKHNCNKLILKNHYRAKQTEIDLTLNLFTKHESTVLIEVADHNQSLSSVLTECNTIYTQLSGTLIEALSWSGIDIYSSSKMSSTDYKYHDKLLPLISEKIHNTL